MLLQRIQRRGRDYERQLDPAYVDALATAYNDFFFHYEETPLLVVNTSDIDFVESAERPRGAGHRDQPHRKGTQHYLPGQHPRLRTLEASQGLPPEPHLDSPLHPFQWVGPPEGPHRRSAMSSHGGAPPRRITIHELRRMKERGEKIAMVTAYDATAARLVGAAGVDVVLVGDSLGMVVQGHDSTLPVTLDQMVYHSAMVRRGLARPAPPPTWSATCPSAATRPAPTRRSRPPCGWSRRAASRRSSSRAAATTPTWSGAWCGPACR